MTPGNFCWSCECVIAGKPVVIYQEPASNDLKSVDFIDPGEVNGIGYDEISAVSYGSWAGFSIAHDENANISVVYVDTSNSSTGLKYVTRTSEYDDAWIEETIPISYSPAVNVDIAYSDIPYIVYNENIRIRLAEKINGSWVTSEVTPSNATGYIFSIAIINRIMFILQHRDL